MSVLLSAIVAPAYAAAVQGEVIDATSKKPLEGATVKVEGGGGSATTGADGRFAIEAPERAILLVSREGYASARVRSGAGPLTVRLEPIYFPDEDVVVTSTRYGAGVSVSQSNLTREDLDERHAVADLPMLLSATPGAYAVSDAGNGMGYTYLSLRGFDQKRVGVMINGIPLNDPEDHQVYWVDLPDFASSVEDAQVQRGVFQAFGSGAAIGGTVNLVTDVHRPEAGGSASLYVGSYGTSKQAVDWGSGLLGGRFSQVARVSHIQSDGYRDRSGTEQVGWFWSGRMLAGPTTTRLDVYGGHEITHHAWYGIGDDQLDKHRRANPETYENAVDDFRQPHVELHNRWDLARELALENSLYWIHGEGFYENFKGDEAAADFGLDGALGLDPEATVDLVRRKLVDKDQLGWIGRLTWTPPRGRLVLGADAYGFHSDHEGQVLGVEGFTPDDLGTSLPYYAYQGDRQAVSGWIDGQVRVAGGLSVLADLHYQHKHASFLQDEVGGFVGELRNATCATWDFLNPRGGLSWRVLDRPENALSVYALAGVSHREPADDDLWDTWTGPDDLGVTPLFAKKETVEKDGEVQYVSWTEPLVDPERVLDVEVGGAWRSEKAAVALNGYWMDFANEIVPYGALNDDGGAVKGNAEATLHRGVELSVEARPVEVLRVQAAAAKSLDEYQDFAIYEDQYDPDTWEYTGTEKVDLSGNPIAGFPGHVVWGRIVGDLRGADPSAEVRSTGRIYLDNTGDDERTIDPWWTLDLALALAPAEWGADALEGVRLDLRVNNVLGAEYETHGYYDAWGAGNTKIPAATRNWLAGMRYTF